MTKLENPKNIISELEKLYSEAVDALCSALQDFLRDGKTPDPEARANGAFCYPELVIEYNPDGPPPPISRAFGKMSEAGTYSTTIAQPKFFERYLSEQLELLLRDYDVQINVRRSNTEIPYAYVWEQGQANGLDEINPAELAKWFPSPQLSDIGDEIAFKSQFDGAFEIAF